MVVIAESCATLCDRRGCRSPGSAAHGIPRQERRSRYCPQQCGGAGLVIAILARQVAPVTPSSGLRMLRFNIFGRITTL